MLTVRTNWHGILQINIYFSYSMHILLLIGCWAVPVWKYANISELFTEK